MVIKKGKTEPEVGAWLQFGYMPELSTFWFDTHGIPLNEKHRGWRTVTLQLILKGMLSEKKCEEIFGKTPTTKAFHRYNNTLQQFRNQGGALAK
jgi:hypothetical protein